MISKLSVSLMSFVFSWSHTTRSDHETPLRITTWRGKRLSANGIAPFSVWPESSRTSISQWSVTASASGVGWWQTPYTWLLTLRWIVCCCGCFGWVQYHLVVNSHKIKHWLVVTLKESQTKKTASVLEQDSNTQKVQKNVIYLDKTQLASFRGNPLCQATERHLNNS